MLTTCVEGITNRTANFECSTLETTGVFVSNAEQFKRKHAQNKLLCGVKRTWYNMIDKERAVIPVVTILFPLYTFAHLRALLPFQGLLDKAQLLNTSAREVFEFTARSRRKDFSSESSAEGSTVDAGSGCNDARQNKVKERQNCQGGPTTVTIRLSRGGVRPRMLKFLRNSRGLLDNSARVVLPCDISAYLKWLLYDSRRRSCLVNWKYSRFFWS